MTPGMFRPWWRSGVQFGILLLLVLCTAAAHAQDIGRTAAADTPGRAVAEFYSWYLQAVARDRDPLRDDPEGLASRVAAPLVQELKRRIATDQAMDADYFLQAQDYDDDWIDHVDVSHVVVTGGSATLGVDLGIRPATRQRLKVTLIRDAGRWKIRRVAPH